MRLVVSLAALAFTAACGSPEEIDLPQTKRTALAIAAAEIGAAPADNAGVQFLPPLAPNVAATGHFLAAAPISLRIEALDAAGGTAFVAASFTRDELHVAGDHFRINWKTGKGDAGRYRIVVSTPARDAGAFELSLVLGPIGGAGAHRAGSTIPIRFRVEAPAIDLDGDGMTDWEDPCPALAATDFSAPDCGTTGPVEPEPVEPGQIVRITPPGEGYGHHGANCHGWNDCGDAATCALWACMVNGYGSVVSHDGGRPCTELTTCHLLDGPGAVEMNWGRGCEVMGVSEIDCAP